MLFNVKKHRDLLVMALLETRATWKTAKCILAGRGDSLSVRKEEIEEMRARLALIEEEVQHLYLRFVVIFDLSSTNI